MRLQSIERDIALLPDVNAPVSDAEARVGAKAVVNLFSKWGLSDAEACCLLGGMSSATYSRWKRGEFGRIGTDLATRLSVLLGIHKSLRILFSENHRAYDFIKRANDAFNGSSTLDVMLGGQITDLFRVRHYLDAARG